MHAKAQEYARQAQGLMAEHERLKSEAETALLNYHRQTGAAIALQDHAKKLEKVFANGTGTEEALTG